MISTHINIFDASVIGVIILSCIFAFYRGFVREILALTAWIGAGLVTLYYFPLVAAKLAPHFKNPTVAGGIGALGLYIVALSIFSIINLLIMKFVKQGSEVGMLDNLLGLIFGAARGAFIISLGFLVIKFALPENQYPEWLKQSLTRPYAEKGAALLASVAPDYIQHIPELEKRMQDKFAAHQADILGQSAGQNREFNPLADSSSDHDSQ